MVHSVPLADALADVGFLRPLLNQVSLASSNPNSPSLPRGDAMLEAVRRAARDWCDNRDLPGHQKHKTRADFSGWVATLAVIESLAYFVTDVNTDYLNYFAKLTIRQNRVSTSPNASRAAIPNPAGSQ